MDLIAALSIAEKIEVLKLIKQQLSAKLRLAAILKQASDAKTERVLQPKLPDELREAVEQAFSDAKSSISDKTDLRSDAVNLELRTLEQKQEEIVELGRRCEKLTEAIKKVQIHVADELSGGSSSSRKRDSAAADLDKVCEEVRGTSRMCKKVKEQGFGFGKPNTKAYSPVSPFAGLFNTTPPTCSTPSVLSIFSDPSPNLFPDKPPKTTTAFPAQIDPNTLFNMMGGMGGGKGGCNSPFSSTPFTAPRSSSKCFDPYKFATVEDEVPE